MINRDGEFDIVKKGEKEKNPLLSPERAALGETGLATSGLAKDLRAAGADDDGLCVGEDGGDGEAAGALDVHEEGARAGHKHLSVIGLEMILESYVAGLS